MDNTDSSFHLPATEIDPVANIFHELGTDVVETEWLALFCMDLGYEPSEESLGDMRKFCAVNHIDIGTHDLQNARRRWARWAGLVVIGHGRWVQVPMLCDGPCASFGIRFAPVHRSAGAKVEDFSNVERGIDLVFTGPSAVIAARNLIRDIERGIEAFEGAE